MSRFNYRREIFLSTRLVDRVNIKFLRSIEALSDDPVKLNFRNFMGETPQSAHDLAASE
jgi:hypothetical protein